MGSGSAVTHSTYSLGRVPQRGWRRLRLMPFQALSSQEGDHVVLVADRAMVGFGVAALLAAHGLGLVVREHRGHPHEVMRLRVGGFGVPTRLVGLARLGLGGGHRVAMGL